MSPGSGTGGHYEFRLIHPISFAFRDTTHKHFLMWHKNDRGEREIILLFSHWTLQSKITADGIRNTQGINWWNYLRLVETFILTNRRCANVRGVWFATSVITRARPVRWQRRMRAWSARRCCRWLLRRFTSVVGGWRRRRRWWMTYRACLSCPSIHRR